MERSNRHFGERPYGKVDFHTWERKPGALAGFIIGLGVSLDGETSPQPPHFTRNLCSERNQCREFSDLEGWQDTSSAQTWGQLFRKSLSAGISESWRGVAPTWQQWCHQLHGWVMWNLCRVLGNVPPVLLPAEGCFPGLCLPLKTKPGDSYPTGTHSLPRELSFAPLSQQQPEHRLGFSQLLEQSKGPRTSLGKLFQVLFHHPHPGSTSEPLAVVLAVFTGRYQLLSYLLFIITTGTTFAVLLK